MTGQRNRRIFNSEMVLKLRLTLNEVYFQTAATQEHEFHM